MSFHCVFLLVFVKCCWAVPFDVAKHPKERWNVLDPCTTMNNQTGVCIRVSYCEPIKTLRQKIKFCEEDTAGVQSSLVCCAVSVDSLPDRAKLPVTTERPIPKDFSICGISNKKPPPKIVGGIANGDDAKLGEWPWMAALYYRINSDPDLKPKCGGSLISANWVVTAAHCIDVQATLILVRFGDLNLNDSVPDGATPVDVLVDEVIVHPEFTSQPVANDIALIRLKNSVTFSEHVRTVCLLDGKDAMFKSDQFYANKVPYVTGYGKHGSLGELATALQHAQIDIVDGDKCAKNYRGYSAVVDGRVLCAGGNRKDSCKGSSGGPLVLPLPSKNKWYLIGVVSFGVGCGDPNYPGVYVKIAEYADWISNVTELQN